MLGVFAPFYYNALSLDQENNCNEEGLVGFHLTFFLCIELNLPLVLVFGPPRPTPSGAVSPFPGCSGHMTRGPCVEMDL